MVYKLCENNSKKSSFDLLPVLESSFPKGQQRIKESINFATDRSAGHFDLPD